jgi:polysaccharide pyruvyl transferase WcaK-like protein
LIGVLHAYSRANAGDGLLVDLTLQRLARHGVGLEEVLLVALDPATFPDVPHRRGVGTPGRALERDTFRAIGRAATLAGTPRRRREALSECRAFVAVGGGYLRTPDLTSSIGTALNHLPQLAVAGASDRPALYLPQSIGPLDGPVGSRVRRRLADVDQVFVRDDTSLDELRGSATVTRLPDLAVLDLAERGGAPAPDGAGRAVALVGRALDELPTAGTRLADLARHLPAPVLLAVQATGDARKSDAAFYERSALEPAGGLSQLLEQGQVGAVVSVRLHGALMSVLAGVPAVHLAYDRKGPAAFADLGLDRWCLDVATADPVQVASLTAELLADPGHYWDAVAARRPGLVAQSEALDASLGRLLGH